MPLCSALGILKSWRIGSVALNEFLTLKRKTQSNTYVVLILAVIIWGLSFVATKIALHSFPPFTLIFFRFSLGSFLFLMLMLREGFPRLTPQEHIKMFMVSLFEPGTYFVCETLGLQLTTAPKASLIIATIPAVVLVFANLILNERIVRQSLFGIGASLAGIAVLIVGEPHFNWSLGGHLLGDLLIFGAVLSASFYIIIARNLGKEFTALEITSMQTFYGAFLFLPGFLWELPSMVWASINTHAIAALIYLTVFATAAAFLCYNHALTKIPAHKAAVFINGIPVVTSSGAFLLLNERLSPIQMGGGLLVLFGVYVTNRPSRRESP